MQKPVIKLLVDSGAFSAFTKGHVINLDEYCKFLLINKEEIHKGINLDVINPGNPEAAASAGWDNFCKMRDRGCDVMPVFHARENFKWLDSMINLTNYIGLSGTSLVSNSESIAWHKLVWSYITDKNGCAIIDTHAFGDTAILSLMTWPWYSCDSATWMIQGGRAGRIKLDGKSYQFRSTFIRDTSYIDENDPEPKKLAWQQELRDLGVEPNIAMKILATNSEIAMFRSYLIAADLLRLRDTTADVTTYTRGASSLLGKKYKLDGGHKRQGPVQLYLAMSPAAWYFNLPVIAALGTEHVLCSYHYINTAPKKFWDERLKPFLYDPVGFCNTNPKVKRYWDKLNEILLKSEATAV